MNLTDSDLESKLTDYDPALKGFFTKKKKFCH